ncbi:MAG: ESX secretion-associated protein EspG [Haloechinothrix sp.]
MLRHQVSIGMETFKTVLDKENLGEPHPTLVGGERWYPADEQRTRDQRAFAELHRLGLVDGGRVSDDFADTLAVLQRAAVEFYTFATVEGVRVTARTAAIGRDAVLIIARDAMIDLYPIPAEQLAIQLATAMPVVPAAQAHSMTCAAADLKAIQAGKTLALTNSVKDAKRMTRWLEMERSNVGQLFAAVRDGAGSRRATAAPVPSWIDTESGRILLSPATHGWYTLSGADSLTIAGRLEQLEKELRG